MAVPEYQPQPASQPQYPAAPPARPPKGAPRNLLQLLLLAATILLTALAGLFDLFWAAPTGWQRTESAGWFAYAPQSGTYFEAPPEPLSLAQLSLALVPVVLLLASLLALGFARPRSRAAMTIGMLALVLLVGSAFLILNGGFVVSGNQFARFSAVPFVRLGGGAQIAAAVLSFAALITAAVTAGRARRTARQTPGAPGSG